VIQGRIKQRGRDYELDIDRAYLSQLNELYDQWISSFRLCPILTVDTENLDYVHYEAHLDEISQRIEDRLQGREVLTLG
jgi:deoxyadenosine/deoxycytidine kinase